MGKKERGRERIEAFILVWSSSVVFRTKNSQTRPQIHTHAHAHAHMHKYKQRETFIPKCTCIHLRVYRFVYVLLVYTRRLQPMHTVSKCALNFCVLRCVREVAEYGDEENVYTRSIYKNKYETNTMRVVYALHFRAGYYVSLCWQPFMCMYVLRCMYVRVKLLLLLLFMPLLLLLLPLPLSFLLSKIIVE